MIRFEVRHDGTHRWRLVNRMPQGADVLAQATSGPDGVPWREAVELRRQGQGQLEVVGTRSGHFQWVLRTAGGSVIAESPAVRRNPQACRAGFADTKRAARTVFKGLREPTAAAGSTV